MKFNKPRPTGSAEQRRRKKLLLDVGRLDIDTSRWANNNSRAPRKPAPLSVRQSAYAVDATTAGRPPALAWEQVRRDPAALRGRRPHRIRPRRARRRARGVGAVRATVEVDRRKGLAVSTVDLGLLVAL